MKRASAYDKGADYLETSYSFDAADRQRIADALNTYDVVIATNYFLRGTARNLEFWREQFAMHPKQDFILVTNTPYEEISIPGNARNVPGDLCHLPGEYQSHSGGPLWRNDAGRSVAAQIHLAGEKEKRIYGMHRF